jgi:hypothetical protein
MPPQPNHDAMDVDMPDPIKQGLFAECSFVVVRGSGINEEVAEQVRRPMRPSGSR